MSQPQANISIYEYYQRLGYKYKEWLSEWNKYVEVIAQEKDENDDFIPKFLMPNKEIINNLFYKPHPTHRTYPYPSIANAEWLLSMKIIYDINYSFSKQYSSVPYWSSGIWTINGHTGKKKITKEWVKNLSIDEGKYAVCENLLINWTKLLSAQDYDGEIVFEIEQDKVGRKYSYLEKKYQYVRPAPRYLGTILFYYQDWELYAVDWKGNVIEPLILLTSGNIEHWYHTHIWARIPRETGIYYPYHYKNKIIYDKRIDIVMGIDEVASS